MRILQVADGYPPDAGGLAGHVRRLAQAQLARGYEVSILAASRRSDRSVEDDLRVVRARVGLDRLPVYEAGSPPFHPPWPDVEFRRALRREVLNERPHAIHAHGWCVFSAALVGRETRTPVLCTLHDYNLACPKKTLLRRGAICTDGRGTNCVHCDADTLAHVKRVPLAAALALGVPWLRKRVIHFMAVSEYVALRVKQHGINSRQISVVPNFIVQPSAGARRPVDSDRSYVLYVGSQDFYKGHDLVVEAYRSLGSVDFDLAIVGGRRERRADDPAGARFVGTLSGKPLADAFQNASIVVVPSIWADPCPTVALEAMSWGRPLIASDVGGLSEIVVHGVTGIKVPPADRDRLAGAIRSLMANPQMRNSMAGAALRHVAHYSDTQVLRQVESVYTQAISTFQAA